MFLLSKSFLSIIPKSLPFVNRTLHISNYLCYKSAISLQNLYPNSNDIIHTPKLPDSNKESDKFNGYIPIEELDITYSRSSGPGGQNVNTNNSKVDLRINLQSSNWLHPEIKSKLIETHKTKISREGFLIIRSDKTRSQQLNLADAMSKLREIIWKACANETVELSPETEEKIRRRKEKATRERLFQKRMRSMTKQSRQE